MKPPYNKVTIRHHVASRQSFFGNINWYPYEEKQLISSSSSSSSLFAVQQEPTINKKLKKVSMSPATIAEVSLSVIRVFIKITTIILSNMISIYAIWSPGPI